MNERNWTRLLSLAGLALLLAACDRLTLENYDKIKTGMSYAEVTAIIGAPKNCSEMVGIRSCTWGDEQHHVSVNFVADRVVLSTAENLR